MNATVQPTAVDRPPGLEDQLVDLCRVASMANGLGHAHVEETHISWVVLAGQSAYKLKKPVDFGFLDFTTRDRRAWACRREVLLNRRLCPELYLGIVPVTECESGLGLGGPGRVIDYAVWMRRLPAELMLDRLLRQGHLSLGQIHEVADRLAAFHTVADGGPAVAAHGAVGVVRHNAMENFDQTSPFRGRFVDAAVWDEIRTATLRFIDWAAPLFERRVESGRIRDGHGDLHAGNVCLTRPVAIYDCIEFNDRFRCGDVAADIAFLAMDLEFHGRPDLAGALVDRYVALTQDRELTAMLDYYVGYRAVVRAKIELFRLDQVDRAGGDTSDGQRRIDRYLRIALDYSRRLGPPKRTWGRPKSILQLPKE